MGEVQQGTGDERRSRTDATSFRLGALEEARAQHENRIRALEGQVTGLLASLPERLTGMEGQLTTLVHAAQGFQSFIDKMPHEYVPRRETEAVRKQAEQRGFTGWQKVIWVIGVVLALGTFVLTVTVALHQLAHH